MKPCGDIGQRQGDRGGHHHRHGRHIERIPETFTEQGRAEKIHKVLQGRRAGCRILKGDDHHLCESLWDLLRDKSYRVSLAKSEAEAAERLAGADVQVVLIDMKLPGGDGRGVLRRVKELAPEARTLLITGYRDEMKELVDEAIQEGASGVCYKPFDMSQLLEMLHEMTQRNG